MRYRKGSQIKYIIGFKNIMNWNECTLFCNKTRINLYTKMYGIDSMHRIKYSQYMHCIDRKITISASQDLEYFYFWNIIEDIIKKFYLL